MLFFLYSIKILILDKLILKGYFKKFDKILLPTRINHFINLDHKYILNKYNKLIYGLLDYYSFAYNFKNLNLIQIKI